jgi:protein TonB
LAVNTILPDFSHWRQPADRKTRLAAGVLTALLYLLFALLIGQRAFWSNPDRAAPPETMVRLLPFAPPVITLSPPFIAHLVRPRAESIAPPSFTLAAEASPPAQLSASAAKTSPLDGGAPTGTGTGAGAGAQTASASGGSGAGLSACLDPEWMRAVSRHVARFFYYPVISDRFPHSGLVYVHFTVTRDGRLLASSIVKGSGSHLLDDAALDILRRATPLPAIPDRMHADRIDAVLPVDFGGVNPNLTPSNGNCGG